MKLDIDYKAIGLRIKAARARKGLTQGNIANLTGLSVLQRYFNTRRGKMQVIHQKT